MALCDSRPDKGDSSRQKVDAGLYAATETPADRRPRWDLQKMPIEFKRSEYEDPFDDSNPAYMPEAIAMKRQDVRGQVISYALKIFDNQHRTCVFSVVIMGKYARIMRWDRSGAVLTPKFDYQESPQDLGEFFWRFSQCSPLQQGYDPTATAIPVVSTVYDTIQKIASDPAKPTDLNYARKLFRDSIEGVTCWKLLVKDSKGKETTKPPSDPSSPTPLDSPPLREFWVGKPFFIAQSLIGRGTRVYVAFDPKDHKFVCLKDAWRVAIDSVQQEGEVIALLNKNDVDFVPTLICHGDLDGQQTVTDVLWKNLYAERECRMKPHTHYRLVEAEVCRPLSDFENGRELVKFILDCMKGAFNLIRHHEMC